MRGEATPGVSPERAARWLVEWATIGGGVTIDAAGNLCPWRLEGGAPVEPAPPMVLVECECDCGTYCPQGRTGIDRKCSIWRRGGTSYDTHKRLMRELEDEPGLIAGVRVLASTAARTAASRAMKKMGRNDE